MDGIANVARQQQSQVSPQETQAKATQQMQTTQPVSQSSTQQEKVSTDNMQETASNNKVNEQKDVENLVKSLNEAMAPLTPDIKFGVDQDDIFYVAAIDTKTDTIIRRFPAAKAEDFLPKMQEVSGLLFDSKG